MKSTCGRRRSTGWYVVRDEYGGDVQATRKDYYQILGVSKTASEKELNKAYRKLAVEWHPDKHMSSEDQRKQAEAKFRDIVEAHEVLTDNGMCDQLCS